MTTCITLRKEGLVKIACKATKQNHEDIKLATKCYNTQ
jgi:hypothetical protein